MNRNFDWVMAFAGACMLYGIVAFIMAVAHITPTIGGALTMFIVGCIITLFKDGM